MQQRDTEESKISTPLKVTCPCCQGEQKLIVLDPDQAQPITMICCHCSSEGTVQAEDDTTVENNFAIAFDSRLQRNELSAAAKREHLRSLGVNAEDIDKTIAGLYPK